MYMCALAGRSCAAAGYQLFAILQNPQFRQQMTSMKAVVGVVCRGRFKGADRPSAPWAGKAGLLISLWLSCFLPIKSKIFCVIKLKLAHLCNILLHLLETIARLPVWPAIYCMGLPPRWPINRPRGVVQTSHVGKGTSPSSPSLPLPFAFSSLSFPSPYLPSFPLLSP